MLFGNPGNPDRLDDSSAIETDIPFNQIDLSVFVKTIVVAIFITIFDLILCYPLAYYLGQSNTGGSGPDLRPASDHPLLGQRNPSRLCISHHFRDVRASSTQCC